MLWNATRLDAHRLYRLQRHLVTALLFCLGVAICRAAPVHLRTDQRLNPLGIDSAYPALSWQSDATSKNWKQVAYQILVASTAEALQPGSIDMHADIWDSGRIASSDSIDVPYSGPALTSRQRCYWTVRTWDANGESSLAKEPANWEMGLLQPADWSAQWIRGSNAEDTRLLEKAQWLWLPGADAQHAPQSTVAEFRYSFHQEHRLDAASLRVLAGGTYTTRVNGVITGHKEEWGSFDHEEIRDALHFGKGPAGDNTIVIQLAVPGSNDATKTFPAALAAVLHLGGRALNEPHGRDTWLTSSSKWEARQLKPVASSTWAPAQQVGPVPSQHFGVGTDRTAPAPTPNRIDSSAALLRKDFTPHSNVVSARLYITALGSYQAFLNGHAIGQSALTPDFTDYHKRVLYQTYDVTPLVTAGHNTLAAVLGAGWHGSPLLWSGTRVFPGADKLRAQLELTYADHTRQLVSTGSDWKTSASPIVSSELYGGEVYDARLDQPGWNTPAFHPLRKWARALVDDADTHIAITAQPDAAVHLEQTLAPAKVTMVSLPTNTSGQQDAVFDMGQNMVGTVRLRVRGTAGTLVRMRFAERLNPDGTVYTENLRDADATDIYLLGGSSLSADVTTPAKDEDFTPAFTFHGFRYVQVSGYPGKPDLSALQGLVLNSLPPAPSMRLDTSSELLNHMNQLGLWGQRGNFLSIPTDCPQRDERMGWMGDAGVFWRTGSYNFDTGSFSHKFMQDVIDAQNPDGAFSNISPNLLHGVERDPGAPGWGDAGVLVPYSAWLQYVDASLIKQSWPAMEQWMDFILRTNPNYLREKDLGMNYADWLAPDPHTPSDLVATAYWAILAQQMQTMATAIGRTADADKYAALYQKIRSAYQQHYVQADGSVAGGTQSSYVLTLYPGLAPAALEKQMTDRLVHDIEAHQTHLTTGFLGTPFLLSVLDTEGRADVAYSLLLNTTYPSWGYMVDKGATTWWERWNGDTGDPSMNSYNHYAFGSVMAWVYRRVAGIDADPASPGFHHIVISPHVDARLPHVHAEYDSAYGTILSDWTAGARGSFHLTLRVPANTTASVYLPAPSAATLEQDGQRVEASSHEGSIVREIGSGSYTFDVLAP